MEGAEESGCCSADSGWTSDVTGVTRRNSVKHGADHIALTCHCLIQEESLLQAPHSDECFGGFRTCQLL